MSRKTKTILLTAEETKAVHQAILNRLDDLLNERPVELEEIDLLDNVLESLRED